MAASRRSAEATGIARSTIGRGLRTSTAPASAWPSGRVRRSGGGRKAAVVEQPGLLEALTELISSAIRGDPQAALLWVSRSQRHLAAALAERGYRVDHTRGGTAAAKDWGSACRPTAKTREGSQHPDRNAQFEHINACRAGFRRTGQPVISVDTKKKELVGDFKNGGRELRPKGQPEEVRVHDFVHSRATARWFPTASTTSPPTRDGSASASITTPPPSPSKASAAGGTHWAASATRASRLLITADCGGSNGARLRLWKVELQTARRRNRPDHLRRHLRPAPASGTASSTACSPSSPRTGAASRW